MKSLTLTPLPRNIAADFVGPASPSVTRALGHWKQPEALRVWKANNLVRVARAYPQIDGIRELENLADDGRALLLGSLIHKAAESLPQSMDSLLGPEALLDPEVSNLAKSYTKFRASPWGASLVVQGAEIPLAATILVDGKAQGVLTGHADMVASQGPDGALAIIDWKTSKRPSISHAYQVSCYAQMYGPGPAVPKYDRYAGMEPGPIPEAYVVYLSKTHKRGKYRIFRCPPMWQPVVLGALGWYDHPYLPHWEEISV